MRAQHRVKLSGFIVFAEPEHQGNHTAEVRWKHPGAAFEKAWHTQAVPVTVLGVRAIVGQDDLFTRSRLNDPATSKAAAHKLELRGSQKRVLEAFQLYGPMTDERAVKLIDRMSPSGVRSRRSELVVLGKLRDSGRKNTLDSGNEGIVWELAQ